MSSIWRAKAALKIVAVMAAAGVALAACGSDAPKDGAKGPTGETTTIRVAFNPGTATRLYAALAHDLFRKHGLDVKLVQFESGAATNAAFASGDVDLGYAGIPGILASRLSNGTRVFMVDNDGADAGGLVATPKSGIKTVADLKGKKVGTMIGTTAWMGLMNALKAEGVNPADVNIRNVAPTAWIPAFAKGDVDAIWAWAPLLFKMENSGGTIVATDTKYTKNPLLWQVRGGFLKEHPEAVSAFVAAYDEASALVEKSDPKFMAKMQEMTGVDQALVKRTVEAVKPVSVKETATNESPYSMTNPAGIEATIRSWMEVLIENKILTKAPSLDGLVDPAPIQKYLAK